MTIWQMLLVILSGENLILCLHVQGDQQELEYIKSNDTMRKNCV